MAYAWAVDGSRFQALPEILIQSFPSGYSPQNWLQMPSAASARGYLHMPHVLPAQPLPVNPTDLEFEGIPTARVWSRRNPEVEYGNNVHF